MEKIVDGIVNEGRDGTHRRGFSSSIDRAAIDIVVHRAEFISIRSTRPSPGP